MAMLLSSRLTNSAKTYLYLPCCKKTRKFSKDARLSAVSHERSTLHARCTPDELSKSPQCCAAATWSSRDHAYCINTVPRPHKPLCHLDRPGPSTPVLPPTCTCKWPINHRGMPCTIGLFKTKSNVKCKWPMLKHSQQYKGRLALAAFDAHCKQLAYDAVQKQHVRRYTLSLTTQLNHRSVASKHIKIQQAE